MEIKHSSPQSARPMEVHHGKRRWPWVLLIVLGSLLVIGGIIAALYFYSGRLLNRDADTTTNNTPTQDQQTDNGDQSSNGDRPSATGFTVDRLPDPDDINSLVIGRFADEGDQGPISLVTVDASDTGTLRETKVLTLDETIPDPLVRGVVSPNGQFIAVIERETPLSGGPTNELDNRITLVELSSGQTASVTERLHGVIDPVWTPDSHYLIYGNSDPDLEQPQQVFSYGVESGETTSITPSEDGPGALFIPVAATKDDLFVIRTITATEDPGALGTFGLSSQGELTNDFEKIISLPSASLGFDISADGREIVMAAGSGQIGDFGGPYTLEILDRSTGEIEELRSSASEKYSSPRFTHDGDRIVYGAASGVWLLDRTSEERTQLIEAGEFELSDEVARPHLVSPDDEHVVVRLVSSSVDSSETWYILALDQEEQLFDDIGTIDPDEDGATVGAFGWTV